MVLVLDNGASSIKAGLADDDGAPRIVPNAVVKPKGGSKLYIGHEIENCRDFFGLYYLRPFEKGILTDWDTEKAIWDKLFSPDGMDLTTRSLSLLVTEPPFNFPAVRETYDQLIFEEYEFASYLSCTPAALIPYGDLFTESNSPSPECCIVVDSGFSFTHVIPIMSGDIIWTSVRRVDVGGKLLTNHLKEIVSFRHWDVMEHTYVMNDVKEACCYVSNSFAEDLEACQVNPRKNPIVQEYVLPDFSTNRRGYIRKGPNARLRDPCTITEDGSGTPEKPPADEPVLYMGNERFTVPEVLLHPSDVGLDQSGLADTIAASIFSLPGDLQGIFWANIGLIGGNFNIPGIETRLQTELRALAPPEAVVGLYKSKNPITEAYYAARAFARSPNFSSFCVTKEEFAEGGSNACRRKFRDNQFGGTVSLSGEVKVGEDEALTEGESRSSTAKVDATAAKAQAEKDARAARRQLRGTKK